MTMTATTMMATKYDDQLGEIYPTMLNELNCTFSVSFSRFNCCGRHGHGLWPSWYRPHCLVDSLPMYHHTKKSPNSIKGRKKAFFVSVDTQTDRQD